MKCLKCRYDLIDEELESHTCRKAKGFRIDGGLIWLSDGIMEYPLKLDKIKEKIHQPTGNTWNNSREDNSTHKMVLLR